MLTCNKQASQEDYGIKDGREEDQLENGGEARLPIGGYVAFWDDVVEYILRAGDDIGEREGSEYSW